MVGFTSVFLSFPRGRDMKLYKRDNYPKYVLTTDYLTQKRSGIIHANLMDFIKGGKRF